ncbi:MAG: UvrD-helicase domain-containing protein, partial [Candidatus Margulisbacteria bacterium]|nr:UvrD-helicase domain-containing protein [Candidatus Margulisiibacteriota bacterium]
MKFIVDFHIHSHFSRATSKALVPHELAKWAAIKGIQVVGTGDCVHPGWLKELKEKLEKAEQGLYKLKDDQKSTRFILTTEISSIYKKNGKTRKVHNVCVLPDFESVEKFQSKLEKIGNIRSDGRPILGLDSRHLLEILLTIHEQAFMIPAHIWTPWFSVLGSKSGFDSVRECFDDLTPHIFALETGLSSDPAMNRACSFLDSYRLVSNSDAHSPEKLGREANLFDTNLTYQDIYESLKTGKGFLGTVEFFPQEGKYHYDGHRKCNICWDPLETVRHQGICPVCGKPVTIGVMYRVAELADRLQPDYSANNQIFHSITPLPELVAEILQQKSTSSKGVIQEYERLIAQLGSEFEILLFKPEEELKKFGGELIAEGIRRLRCGQVYIDEGYDGEFGKISVFQKKELKALNKTSLFVLPDPVKGQICQVNQSTIEFDIQAFKQLHDSFKPVHPINEQQKYIAQGENLEQKAVIEAEKGMQVIIAGPGSGKTHVLTERIVYLVEHFQVQPENILAVTFSNKAAQEISERLKTKIAGKHIKVSTFHAFGLEVLRKYHDVFERTADFFIIEEEKTDYLSIPETKKKETKKILKQIERFKQGIDEEIDPATLAHCDSYNQALQNRNVFDLEDLICLPVKLFQMQPQILAQYQKQINCLLVDEFQDINEKQYELINLLIGKTDTSVNSFRNVMIIGDPDQAIYGFRGSDARLMERFQADYPEAKVISLNRSYRCPENILKAAGQVLQKKYLLSGKTDPVKIHLQQCETD